ncbi:MAG TPA: phosphate ABC transporter permease PtsA, partial [Burkholderiaceae bacterium]|nr:phosphate ABC transporter permease PtsA [Burkholderiaceae bacterium]
MTDLVISAQNAVYRRRRRFNRIMLTLSGAAVVFGLFWLCWIIVTLLHKGAGAVSISLLTEMTPPPGQSGGLLNAIVGSV